MTEGLYSNLSSQTRGGPLRTAQAEKLLDFGHVNHYSFVLAKQPSRRRGKQWAV